MDYIYNYQTMGRYKVCKGLLPELILRLIRATSTNTSNIRFPNGDAVHLTGWDGVVESADAIFNM